MQTVQLVEPAREWREAYLSFFEEWKKSQEPMVDSENITSRKTIIRNGGMPDTDYIEEDGNRVNRFWLE
ncbi:hypothetical protein [Paenibacillus sp. Aloe-11]|uniref:hypothetical protein n=1 Tax=Paenibacillus sp. Aloe-11 TaxID=1050222 RepID=UPI00024F063C|nr:hypothetical protein [Paenibacillus sp. Aloe-11]EHS58215.1 hypothetical protein WG8_1475 [Paenibacillus sp. Aloe-11]